MWTPSGYGTQAASLLPRLAELPEFDGGRDDSQYLRSGRKNWGQHAWYGLQSGLHFHQGFTIYPAGNDPYGNDIIGPHMKHFGANVLFSLIDVWVLRSTSQSIAPALFCPWFPVDHDPIPARVLDSLAGAHTPLTYAKWGHEMCNKLGIANTYIPHGIETGIYRVFPDRDKVREFKAKFTKRDDTHLTLMVAANKGYPPRKAFPEQLQGWAAFAKDKPHAKLHIHTEPTPVYGGIDFGALIADLGIADKVTFPDRYENFMGYPQERLALLYNTADMFLGASMSEGFGIPLIEAQATGTPVITTNFSAMPELVRWGEAVEPMARFWTPMNAWQVLPDPKQITETLERYHALWLDAGRDWPLSTRLAAQNAIHSEYSWDTIVREQWAPLMTRLAEEAPPLDSRFQVAVSEVPQTHTDDVTSFINEVQAGIAASKPKRRVAPLKAREVTQ
jgi:glycosyltransferase involved in cell wall biosynthesis